MQRRGIAGVMASHGKGSNKGGRRGKFLVGGKSGVVAVGEDSVMLVCCYCWERKKGEEGRGRRSAGAGREKEEEEEREEEEE